MKMLKLPTALLLFVSLPGWAQTCTKTTGTVTNSCAGSNSYNGGSEYDHGGSPAAPGSGVGGTGYGYGGAGGAFGGSGGDANLTIGEGGGGGGGGTYGGGGGSGAGAGGGGGGGGNPGIVASGSLVVPAAVTVTGGLGSDGQALFLVPVLDGGGGGASGGGGATAVIFGLTGASLTNAGTIAGGSGGNGVNGNLARVSGGAGGGGGGGGPGLSIIGASNTITNSGNISGGNGGNDSSNEGQNTSSGGGGGAGVGITGAGNTFTNTGSITGGVGGSLDLTSGNGSVGPGGVGVGISNDNNILVTSGNVSGGLDGSGKNQAQALTITGNNNTLELESGYSFSGNVSSTGSNNTLVLGGNTNASFDVSTIGNEFTGFDTYAKNGSSTWTLTNTTTAVTPWTIYAGTLDVEGSLKSAVSVDSGGTLIGTGSLGDLTVASGGTLSPGNSGNAFGALTVNGNVNLVAGSTYQVNGNNSSSSSLIHATGTAILGGGSVMAVLAGSSWNASTRYTILIADGGVSGTFGSVSDNFAFLTPTLTYDADNAYLTLVPNLAALSSVGVTSNEVSTGADFATGAPKAVYFAVLPLAVVPARAAFAELAGDSLASTRTAIIDDSHYVRDAINTHLQGVQGTGEITQNDDQGSVWASIWGHGGDHGSDGNAARLSSTGSGVLVGADRDLGTLRLGAVAGSGQLSNNSAGAAADAHSTDTAFGLYSGLDLGAWQLQGGATHSWYETRSHRQIDVPTLGGFATASFNNGVTQAYVDGGYQFKYAQSSLTPYVELARVWAHQGAINEGGDVAALVVQANGTSVDYGAVGLRGVFEPSAGLQLHADIGYQHAWGDLRSFDQQRFVNGGVDSFTVVGLPVSKNAGIVDLGIRFALSRDVSVDGSYVGQFAKGATDQGARLSLNVTF